MVFSAIATVAGVNFAGVQVYALLAQIPEIPIEAVDLSMYLVGMYDFLLSIVGIVIAPTRCSVFFSRFFPG